MKKSFKTKAIAAAFITGSLLSLTGCDGALDEFEIVYGPPVGITPNTSEDTTKVTIENNKSEINIEGDHT